METLKIWKTHPKVQLPQHQTQQSACFDIAFQSAGKSHVRGFTRTNKPIERIVSTNRLTISPGDRLLIPTGMIMDIPLGYSVRLHARSGMSLKQGLVLANSEGVIDSDYVEEVFVMITNISDNAILIEEGSRIAQGELVKNVEYTIEQTISRPLGKTSRSGGFGSTGVVTTILNVSEKEGTLRINIPDETPVKVTKPKAPEPPVKRGRGRPAGVKNKVKK
jgi:dUTP pyrophosphatase